MVVLLHSENLTMKFNSGNISFNSQYNTFIQNFFSEGITRIAVPIFFCISGYLFYLNCRGTFGEFILKYKKRAKSLALPYLLWSLWGLVFYFALQNFPQSKNFFTKELIINYSFLKFLDTLFINPIPYQLWFIRDLIVIVLLSPLIYWIIKYLRIIPLVILSILWLDLFDFTFIIFSNEAILFFCLGAYFSIHQTEYMLQKLNQKSYLVFLFVWILIVFYKTILISQNSDQQILITLLHKISIWIGMVAIWSLYDIKMLKEKPNKPILYLSQFSFFIYVFHEPILSVVKKGLFYIIGSSEMASLAIYITGPIITITLSIITAALLKKYLLKFYEFITGAR